MQRWYSEDTEGRRRLDNFDPLAPGYDGRLLASRAWVRRLLAAILPIALSGIYRRLDAIEKRLPPPES